MSTLAKRWLGIDFSGNAGSWRPGSPRNIWIAEAAKGVDKPSLQSLRPIQHLEGEGEPYRRLLDRLKRRDFAAAAIDAPFSVPAEYLPEDGWAALLRMVTELPLEPGHPFARGHLLVRALAPELPSRGRKVYRRTEGIWPVNVRSTLWCGPRGGAPFTVACLSLIAGAGLPCWPWTRSGDGLLVEAFPAAQLWTWTLPFQKYAAPRPDQVENRSSIVADLKQRIDCEYEDLEQMRQSADALDAVLCCFAAIAVTENQLAKQKCGGSDGDGWIAVHQ